MPRCRRWQGGTETSCSCPVSGQEPRVRVRLSGSYLRGSGFGHANSAHNWSYARTPRASPRCAAQHGLRLPRPLQMAALAAQQQSPAGRAAWAAVTSISTEALTSSSALQCHGCIASDARASLFGFSTSMPCSFARVLFTRRKAGTHLMQTDTVILTQLFFLQPMKPHHIMTCLPLPLLRKSWYQDIS